MSIRQDFIVARLIGRSSDSDLCIEIGHFSRIDGRDVRRTFRSAVCRGCGLGSVASDCYLEGESDLTSHIERHAKRGDRVPTKIGKALETAGRFFEVKP